MSLFLGIDFGTSGVRAAVIDRKGSEVASSQVPIAGPSFLDGRPVQDPALWRRSLDDCLDQLNKPLIQSGHSVSEIRALSVDGTSGTLLLADSQLNPVTPALMYNSSGFAEQAQAIDRVAPEDTPARGPSSALARLLYLQSLPDAAAASHAMHQADWIAAQFTSAGGTSDQNNALKTGFDPAAGCWPEGWFERVGVRMEILPEVIPAGEIIGPVHPTVCARFGFGSGTLVVAGTTDSVAAFVASGASTLGDGVSSLGTTLAIKLLSDVAVTDQRRGVYSHRIFGMWLAGGASNTGGGALLKHFTRERMIELSERIDTETPSGLDYYPLPRNGERFPVADPDLEPVVAPRPDDDALHLQGLFEGIARIERAGYDALRELGAPSVTNVRSVGGGAANPALNRIRERTLGCPTQHVGSEAAVGSAIVAKKGWCKENLQA